MRNTLGWALVGLGSLALTLMTHAQDADPAGAQKPHSGRPSEPLPGPYRAWLDCPGGEIRFGLELAKDPTTGAWSAWYQNGPEREPIARVGMENGTWTMHFDPYGSTASAPLSPRHRSLHGKWHRDLGGGKSTLLNFHAIPTRHPLYRVEQPPKESGLSLARRYKVQFSEDKHHSVGLFDLDPDSGRVDATFLTTLGDYRYLSGVLDGPDLTLAAFDGAHAFLFKAKVQSDGTLQGDFWSRDVWHETWTASPDPEVTLPDPFGLTRFVGGVPLEKLAFPDVEGQTRSLADPAFAGQARLIVLLGTWCPNCNDLTKYLVELHQRYAAKDLSILGLAFEFGDDPQRHTQAVQRYIEHHAVPYPILIAGPHNKQQAAKIFPVLDQVMAYPTTLFLDAQGNVQAVYTGFSGPATGAHHQKLREAFERRIDTLLAGQD